MSKLTKFSLLALVTMDGGRIREALEQAIKRCEIDCADRPGQKDARKVALNISISPVMDDEGHLDSCSLQFNVTDSLPRRKSKVYSMRATAEGLLFNDMSLDDVDQETFDVDPEDEVPRGPSFKKGAI